MGFVKAIIAASLLFLISIGIQEETILWEKDRRLTWEDFKGTPNNNRAAAITASGLTYRFSTVKKDNQVVRVDFKVSSFFYPQKSWYIPAICDSITLKHEQLHFDITEVFAEKFRKRLAKTTFTNNVKAEVKIIYDEINVALQKFQNKYDLETDFSRNRENQANWNQKIDSLLR